MFSPAYRHLSIGLFFAISSLIVTWFIASSNVYFHHVIKQDKLIYLELKSGAKSRILGIQVSLGEPTLFQDNDFIPSPDIFATYTEYNQWLVRQQMLYTLANSEDAFWLTLDGSFAIKSSKSTPTAELSPLFWMSNIAGPIALVFGVWFGFFKRDNPITIWLCINAISFALIAMCFSIYNTRQLFLPLSTFQYLLAINHLAITYYGFSLLAIICHYPRAVFGKQMIWMAILPGILWLNSINQWFQWPLNTFFAYQLPIYLLGIIACVLQWKRAINRPDERAALSWLYASILVSVTIILVLSFIPLFFGKHVLVNDAIAHAFGLIIYLGIILCIARYRLFDIERWWFNVIGWYFLGISLLVIDLIFISLLDLDQVTALPIAIL